jgi:hypothetical protein
LVNGSICAEDLKWTVSAAERRERQREKERHCEEIELIDVT